MLAESSHGPSAYVLDLLAILAASALVALLLRRFPQAMIPCYLIAGAVIGPSALGLAGEPGESQSVASLATILLLFTIGLHLDIGAVRGGLASTALIATLAAILTTLLLWPLLHLLGLTLPGALAAAMALSISSTAVVLRVLDLKRQLHRVHGRLTLGILLVQDLIALGIIALIPFLATWAAGTDAAHEHEPFVGRLSGLAGPRGMLADAALAIAGITLLIVIGRKLLPRVLSAASGTGEALLVVSSAIALGAAVATAGLGFSPELGAFLAGFLLASTPFRYQLSGQLVPLRELFLAVFFTALGLQLPLGTVFHEWRLILVVLAATVVIKPLVLAVSAWVAGAGGAVAAYVGLAMAQGSEFSLVILTQSHGSGVLSDRAFAVLVATVVGTLVLTPALIDLGQWSAVWAARIPPAKWIRGSRFRGEEGAEAGAAPAAPPAIAIVAGFGPVGRAVADRLEKLGVGVRIIELNPRTVERQHGMGRSILYGDAANPDVLEHSGVREAGAVILTMPDEEAVLRACRLIRSLRKDIFIAARLNSLSKALQAMQLGADHTVVEELATAEAMAAQVMLKLRQREAGEDTGPRLYDPGR